MAGPVRFTVPPAFVPPVPMVAVGSTTPLAPVRPTITLLTWIAGFGAGAGAGAGAGVGAGAGGAGVLMGGVGAVVTGLAGGAVAGIMGGDTGDTGDTGAGVVGATAGGA